MQGSWSPRRAFLTGQCGERISAHDWSGTLGPLDDWPSELCAMLSIILRSGVPSAIYWGAELRLLFNDAWAALHIDRADRALGEPGRKVWPEIWPVVGPQLERVMSTAQGVIIPEQMLTLNRNGVSVDTFWRYTLTPLFADDGSVAGVVSQSRELTDETLARRDRETEILRLHQMLERVPSAMALLRGSEHVCEVANTAYQELLGRRDLLGQPLARVAPDMARQGFLDILDKVYSTGEPFIGSSIPVSVRRDQAGVDEERVFDILYQPVNGEDGSIDGIFVHGSDMTDRARIEAALRESEERLTLALGAASIGIWDFDPVTGVLRWDDRCKAMFGLPPDAEVTFEGTFLAGLHPQDSDATERAVAEALSPNGPGSYDVEYRTIGLEDGIERWIAATGRSIFQGGQAVRFIGAVVDITERKRAEAALAASEAALREESRLLEILNRTADEVAAELDLDRLVQLVVDAGVQITGARFGAFFYNSTDDQGDSYMLYALAGADRAAFERFSMPRATAVFAPTFRGEAIVRSDDITQDPRYGRSTPHHGMPKGHLPVRSYLAVPVTSRSGEVIGGLLFGHDAPGVFTERAERLMSGLAGQAAIGIDNARLFQAAQRLNQTLEAQVGERTAALRRREAQLRSIVETSYQYMGLLSPDGTLLEANATSLDGIRRTLSDVAGMKYWETPWFSATPEMPDMVRAAVERVAAGETVRQEMVLNLPTGQRAFDFAMRPVRDPGGQVIAIVPEAVELTERRRAEELLRQSQKMEAVGQLTGGIAHDFNNMLAVVMGSLNLMQRRIAKGDTDVGRYVEAAMDGARRAASLTQRLLAFSRQQPLAPEAIDASHMITGMSELLASSLGETIRVETIAAGGLWRVHADPNQLENALLNLAVNARDAMPDGGCLTIETANAAIDDAYAHEHGVAAGDYVMIAVTDTGTGMTSDVAARATEPFFTTKDVGAGTGLGLSQVFGFVRQSGGHMKIYSEPGYGTAVKLYLPRHRSDGGGIEPKRGEAAVLGGTGQERVLVVEDEARVRTYSVEALRELGYTVIDAPSPREALAMIEAGLQVTLLFTDVVMPEMTGPQLAERAVGLLPGLKVLYTTGYTRNAVFHGGVLDKGTSVLQKPFSVEQLAAKVRGVLDA
jgi:PAS domain S-box-containing protein